MSKTVYHPELCEIFLPQHRATGSLCCWLIKYLSTAPKYLVYNQMNKHSWIWLKRKSCKRSGWSGGERDSIISYMSQDFNSPTLKLLVCFIRAFKTFLCLLYRLHPIKRQALNKWSYSALNCKLIDNTCTSKTFSSQT